MRRDTRDRGNAIAMVVVLVLIVAVLTASYLGLSSSKGVASANDNDREQAFRLAEAGLTQALFELNASRDYDVTANGIGTVASTALKDGTYIVAMDTSGLTGNQKRLTSTGTYGKGKRSIEAIVDLASSPASALGMAGIVSRDAVDVSGNITIDGRDYTAADVLISGSAGNGVYGVASGGAISVGGSSATGGNGNAPPSSGAAANSLSQNRNWSSDGYDNDRDGTVDEAGETFPTDADQALGLPAGSLKAAAQASSTYYTSQAAYEAALAANGNQFPSGKIVYCDFTPSPPFELGSGYNTNPSILVVHNSTSTANAKNVHGDFKGLFFADAVEHINSGTKILGMVHAWGLSGNLTGNLFGNGNSTVHFSSAVLATLPSVSTSTTYSRLSWREVVQ